MDLPPLQARRATIDDLESLLELWNHAGLPGQELEKYLTEFQIVADPEDGRFLGSIGLMAASPTDGLIHTEVMSPGAPADAVRQALWRRLEIVARNQGLHRLWTQEDDDYWQTVGFAPASTGEIATMPAPIRTTDAPWQLNQLVQADRAQQLVNEQMAIWDASRLQEREHLLLTISHVRTFALVFVSLVTVVILLMALYVVLRRPDILARLFGR